MEELCINSAIFHHLKSSNPGPNKLLNDSQLTILNLLSPKKSGKTKSSQLRVFDYQKFPGCFLFILRCLCWLRLYHTHGIFSGWLRLVQPAMPASPRLTSGRMDRDVDVKTPWELLFEMSIMSGQFIINP